ncbi:MAG TPA: zinc metalloprotease HtpX [Actinomycetota bacterium]|nr:zinc metalloprotease HtpX [Actinomycetota bacterium]
MKNNMKTALLLGSLAGLMVVLGNMLGGRSGAVLGLIFAAVMNLGSYWFSDKIALKMSRARPVSRAEAPELYSAVHRLTERAGLPMPTLHLIPSKQPNAFATGRNPAHAAVAVTEGILEILSPEELEGVLAHELAHVRNRDILIASVAATIAGAISFVATMARWGAMFGGGDDEDNPGGVFGILVASIVAPLAAMIMQMAVSRSREFAADALGAEIAGRPQGLANALRKLEVMSQRVPMAVNPSAAPMFIVNPLRGSWAQGASRMFSTHPPTEERIRRLNEISARTGYMA